MTERQTLTRADVERLLADPSEETRGATAAKLGQDYDSGAYSDDERHLAEEIFRLMVRDAAVRVREALSESLKSATTVPHDVALALAEDVESVATPMLEESQVLTEDDLLTILRTARPENSHHRAMAMARRARVSPGLSEALVHTDDAGVVCALMGNQGADVGEDSLQHALDTFPRDRAVTEAMVDRDRLPMTVSERLVTLVSEKLRARIAARHQLPEGLADALLLQSRERATVGLAEGADDDELMDMVAHLRRNDRLTPSLLVRAVCGGDLPFFEAGMAEMAGLTLDNTRMLIHDSGPLGLQGIADKTSIPAPYLPVMRAALAVMAETELDGEPHDRQRHARQVMERVLTQAEWLAEDFEPDDLDYLLTRLDDLPAEAYGTEPAADAD